MTPHVFSGREGATVVLLRLAHDDVDLTEEEQDESDGRAQCDRQTHRQHLQHGTCASW